MGSNSLPTNGGQLIVLGNKMEAGVVAIGAQIPVTLITAAQLQANLNAFGTVNDQYNVARSARQTASDAVQAGLPPLYDWLLGASNVLATIYGNRWNTGWAQAGFINHTTSIPGKTVDRIALATALVAFFTKNPSYELPAKNITAGQGKFLRDAVTKALGLLAAATVAINDISDAWTTAYDALVQTMRELIKNLEAKLADDDARWLTFGLQMPATITTPGKPVNLTAHADGTGAIIVQCDAVPLATRYRFRMLLVGAETEYKLAVSATEPLASINGVEPGQPVQLIVQAVNGSLQGVASDPIQFTALLPETVKSEARKEKPAELATRGNGHGKENGQAMRIG